MEHEKIRSFCYFEHFVRYAVSYWLYRFRHVKTDRLRIKRETKILYTIDAKKQENIQDRCNYLSIDIYNYLMVSIVCLHWKLTYSKKGERNFHRLRIHLERLRKPFTRKQTSLSFCKNNQVNIQIYTEAIRIYQSCSNFHSDIPGGHAAGKMHLYIISHENGDFLFIFILLLLLYRQGNVERRRLTLRHRIASRDPCIRYRVR